MEPSALARQNMTKGQLLTCHVRNPDVLAAIAKVPREDYLPEAYQGMAYVDEEIPLGDGRFLMEPLVFARLLELADVRIYHKVLDIGCGYGYAAAVLALRADKVVAVENHPDFVGEARKRLGKNEHIEVITAPLATGCPMKQPYDVIFIEGAVEHVPPSLLQQLAEGGCLVTVERYATRPGSPAGACRAMKIVRRGSRFETALDFDASVALLPGFERKASFDFN